MNGYTKGPWKVVRDGRDIRVEPVNDVCPFWLAKMVSPRSTGMAYGEREANASVMAAAPELLEACLDFLHGYCDEPKPEFFERMSDIAYRMRMATRKAEGK